MKYTIKSKRLKKLVTFSKPGRFHLYVDLNGRSGSLGNQICKGGELMGSTIGLESDDENLFRRTCKTWLCQYYRTVDAE